MRIKVDIAKMSKATLIPSNTIVRALSAGKHPETLFHYFVRALVRDSSPNATLKAIMNYYLLTRLYAKNPTQKDIKAIETFFESMFREEDPCKALRTWKRLPMRFHKILLEILIGCLHAQRDRYVREYAHCFRK